MPNRWIKFLTSDICLVVLAGCVLYSVGYFEGSSKASAKEEAEKAKIIAAYQHSSVVAAEQYALQLKKAQEEKQQWYDFSQKQSADLAAALSELDKTRNTLQEQTREAVDKDGGSFSGIGSRSLHLYNRAFGYTD